MGTEQSLQNGCGEIPEVIAMKRVLLINTKAELHGFMVDWVIQVMTISDVANLGYFYAFLTDPIL